MDEGDESRFESLRYEVLEVEGCVSLDDMSSSTNCEKNVDFGVLGFCALSLSSLSETEK